MKNRKQNILRAVGRMCKEYREYIGVTQSDVSRATGYSEQNISSFETGRTNNMILLLWYIDNGMFKTTYKNESYKLHRLLRGDKE